MTIQVRKSSERGQTKIDWLDSKHTFSFGDYHDSRFTHFGSLRVINEDIVTPESGFGTHSHQNMEILTYVLSGELGHKDSMGNGSVIAAGSIQRMSAGTGVQHSEWNHSKDNPVHFLQIWIFPESNGLPPSYEEKALPEVAANQWQVMASNQVEGGLLLHQDVTLQRAKVSGGDGVRLSVQPGRMAWLHVVSGSCSVDATTLGAGDAFSTKDAQELIITSEADAEVLWFDLKSA